MRLQIHTTNAVRHMPTPDMLWLCTECCHCYKRYARNARGSVTEVLINLAGTGQPRAGSPRASEQREIHAAGSGGACEVSPSIALITSTPRKVGEGPPTDSSASSLVVMEEEDLLLRIQRFQGFPFLFGAISTFSKGIRCTEMASF